MKKSTKIILIVSLSLMLVGGILAGVGFAFFGNQSIGWDKEAHKFVKINEQYTTMEKTRIDKFDSLDVYLSMGNVELIPSDDYYIEYRLIADNPDEIVSWDKAELNINDTTNRYYTINFSWISHKEEEYVKVYYPSDADLAGVNLVLDMGSLNIDGLRAGTFTADCSMGDANIKNTISATTDLTLDMGTLTVNNSDLGKCDSDLSMGDMDIYNSNFSNLSAVLDMGSMSLENVLIAAGANIDVSMGDADVVLNTKAADNRTIKYGFDCEVDMGEIEVNDDSMGTKYKTEGDSLIKITCDMGSIDVELD